MTGRKKNTNYINKVWQNNFAKWVYDQLEHITIMIKQTQIDKLVV